MIKDVDRHQEFLTLYLHAQSSVRQLLRVLIQDRHLVDDACQAVALRLWQLFENYDRSRPFDVWARGVAARVALELNRAERSKRLLLSQEAVDAVIQAFDRPGIVGNRSGEELQALDQCLKAIPHHTRELIFKRYHQSLPVDEIATQLDRTIGATYKAIERSVQTLAECVRQRLSAAPIRKDIIR